MISRRHTRRAAPRRALYLHVTVVGLFILMAGAEEGVHFRSLHAQGGVAAALHPAFIINEWEGPDSPAFIANPMSVAISEDKEIFVLDGGNHRVAVFSAEGEFRRSFGRAGEGPGEFALGGLYRSADISIRKEEVVVLDPLARRVHFFSLEGELRRTFALAQSPSSLTSNEQDVYLRVSGYTNAEPAEILVFEGDNREGQIFALPLLSAEAPGFSRFNRSAIAAAPDGRVMQAYSWWPILRLHGARGGTDERVVLQDWWADEDIPGISRTIASFHAAREAGTYPVELWRSPFFDDIDHVSGTDTWVALAKGRAYFFDDERTLTAKIDLLPPKGMEAFFAFLDIGVDPQGTLLCGADAVLESKVACYDISIR